MLLLQWPTRVSCLQVLSTVLRVCCMTAGRADANEQAGVLSTQQGCSGPLYCWWAVTAHSMGSRWPGTCVSHIITSIWVGATP